MASIKKPTFRSPLQEQSVTLGSWTRLNNAPLLLPKASAVYWNDYLFVVNVDGTAALYHEKLGMWSMLQKFSELGGLLKSFSITLHNNQILVGSSVGYIYYFDESMNMWKKHPDYGQIVATGKVESIFTPCWESVHLASCNGSLCAINLKYADQEEVAVFRTKNEGWETILNLGSGPIHSVALVDDHLFVHLGETLKKINMSSTGPLKASNVTSPPTGATLHCINNTLFSFGGHDQDYQPTSDVLRFNTATKEWESAGYMRNARYSAFVASSDKEVFVIGGCFGEDEHRMKPKIQQGADEEEYGLVMYFNEWGTCIVEKCTWSVSN